MRPELHRVELDCGDYAVVGQRAVLEANPAAAQDGGQERPELFPPTVHVDAA